MTPTRRVQVVVIGGGPSGSVTAALLAESGHDVCLFDQAHFPRSKPCAEYLSPGAVRLLDSLGLSVSGGRPLRGMQLVAPNGRTHLVEYGGGYYACSLPRTQLDLGLLQAARRRGVAVHEQHRVLAALVDEGNVCGVAVRSPCGLHFEVHAGCVVGADGLNSVLVHDRGLRRARHWPARLGLVAHIREAPWPEDFGQMWVGQRGYVGVAPTAADALTVGAVMSLKRGTRMHSPIAALWDAVAQFPQLSARLAHPEVIDAVRGVGPLARAVQSTSGPGFLLVGDAAGFFDPFTGEGLFRAFRGADLAARAVRLYLSGDGRALAGYDATRARVFGAKERLAELIQLFVRTPALMNYAVQQLAKRPLVAAQLGRVLGDLAPAETVLRPAYLAQLLRP